MAGNDTPMMRQYRRIKSELSDDTSCSSGSATSTRCSSRTRRCAAEILDIALTKRQQDADVRRAVPSAGDLPGQADPGRPKVAICDQVEDPAEAKGIVRREVTRVVTPARCSRRTSWTPNRNNYLAGLCRTGTTLRPGPARPLHRRVLEGGDRAMPRGWATACVRYAPSECIVPEELDDDRTRSAPTCRAGPACAR